MRRLHLLELHEQPFIPARLRSQFQTVLAQTIVRLGGLDGAVEPMARLLQLTGATEVLDLCSGGGLPTLGVISGAARALGRPAPRVILSDLYPDLDLFARLERAHDGRVGYVAGPVDVTAVPAGDHLPRVRVLCTSMHHFAPAAAREILRSAARDADGIAIFEPQERSAAGLLSIFGVGAMAAFVDAFMRRPWRPWHPLLGLLMPVVPCMAAADGFVSCMRTYTADDLQGMADDVGEADFAWQAGRLPIHGGLFHGVYLIGWRRRGAARERGPDAG